MKVLGRAAVTDVFVYPIEAFPDAGSVDDPIEASDTPPTVLTVG